MVCLFQVLLAASVKSCSSESSSNAVVNSAISPSNHCVQLEKLSHEEAVPHQAQLTDSLRFLNRVAEEKPNHMLLQCTVQQVEDVKIVLKMLPIFACTIMLNCCLAQLSTFSVQ